MTTVWRDLRQSVRLLARQPSFTAVAVLVLALGIGANSAVFSLVNVMLFKPRPGHPGGEVVQLVSRDATRPDTYRGFSYPNYLDLRARTDVFASLAAHGFALGGLEDGGRTRRVFVDAVSANFFEAFGAPLTMGRYFTPAEERPGANEPVTILSYQSWQRMGASPTIVGQTVRLNARPFTVVGVAQQGFGGSLALVTPEMWVPLGVYDSLANDFMGEQQPGTLADRQHHALIVVARLAPDASIGTTNSRLDAIGRAMAQAYPAENHDQTLLVAPLSRMSVSTNPEHEGPLKVVSAALLCMSGLVLLIASFNLANMLLARSTARRREFAVRAAIGGSRSHLVRQLLIEGSVLAAAGGAVGLVLAVWATKALATALASIAPVAISYDSTPDVRVMAATVGFCAMATILFSLGPALGLARTNILSALRDRVSDLGGGRRLRLQHLLVMGQLALTLALLTVGGIFLRGAVKSASLDPGFSFDRGIMVHTNASLGGLPTDRIGPTYARVLDALRARPDVAAAGIASLVPFGDITESAAVQHVGAPLEKGDTGLVDAVFTITSAGYFDAIGLKILAGRDFTTSEERTNGGERLAILDQPLASRLFGTTDPIGQQVQYDVKGQPPAIMRVVGVVPGTRHDVFDPGPVAHLYVPLGQHARSEAFIHVRTSVPTPEAEAALLPSIRRTVESVDAALPVLSIDTRASYRDHNDSFALLRVGAAVFSLFGLVALLLATAGVYGVKAYVVSSRTREIGIRMALGATATNVIWTVVREGFTLAMVGLGAGLVLSVVTGAAMRAMAFDARGADLTTVGVATVVLAAAAIAASWIPARRATRVEPTTALRAE